MIKLYSLISTVKCVKTVPLTMAGIILIQIANAQSTGDYRTKAAGNWNALTTWERYSGSAWVQPTSGQGTPNDGDGAITIISPNVVTVTVDVDADQLTVDSGGQITINAGITLTIETGTGTDLNLNGTILNHGALELATNGFPPSTATASFNTGSVYKHNQTGGTIPGATWNANATLEFSNGGTTSIASAPNLGPLKLFVTNNTAVSIAGSGFSTQTLTIGAGSGTDLQVDAGSSISFANSYDNLDLSANATALINGTITVANEYNSSAAGTSTVVNGTFVHANNATLTGLVVANFNIGASGFFDHNRNGSTVPTSTWTAGSTLRILGMTSTYPGGMTQSFQNVVFQSTLTSAITMSSGLIVLGNLTVSNSGTDDFRLTNNATGRTIAVTGNFSITGGDFILVSDAGNGTLTVGGNFTQSGGIFIPKEGNGTATVTITGNLAISGGTFDQHASGTGTSTVNTTGNFALSGGTYDMCGTNGANGTYNLGGNYSHSGGTLTESGNTTTNGLFNFVGDRVHTFSATTTALTTQIINYTVGSGDTLQFDLPTTLVSGAGTFTVQAGSTIGVRHTQGIATVATGASGQIRTTGRVYTAGANYIYNGSANQATGTGLTANNPGNLTINNPGNTVTLSTATTLSGSLLIAAGTLASNNFNLSVPGNWTDNGIGFTAGTGTVTLTGTGTTTIGGSTVTSFNNLSINKTSGTAVLAQNINVNGTLAIGVNLNLAAFNLTLGNTSPAVATINGTSGVFSATKMIVASGAGKLQKWGTTAAQLSYLFPIGDNTGTAEYSPLTLAFTATSIARTIAVGVVDAAQPNNLFPTNLLSRYWTVTNSAAGTFSTSVTVQYVTADIVGTEANLRLGKWDGAEPWVRFATAPDLANNRLTGSPITSFSDFTGLSINALLPVKLNNFSASLVDKSAVLDWTTFEEINSSFYDVEHSTDGQHFTKLSSVASKNSPIGSSYSYKHINPATGQNYYRLKMVDIDAKFEYSPIITLKYTGTQKQLNAYPNPATNDVTIQFEKASKGAFLRVIDMQGKVVQSVAVPAGATLIQVKLNGVTGGIYNIIYENNGEKTIHRIQKN